MGVLGNRQAAAVIVARIVDPPQFFARLAAVIISRRVRRVVFEQRFKFRDGFFELATLDMGHGETIADERIGWVLREELLQLFDAGGQASG